MNNLKIKKNDKVVVLSGKDKGKTGKVLGTVPSGFLTFFYSMVKLD